MSTPVFGLDLILKRLRGAADGPGMGVIRHRAQAPLRLAIGRGTAGPTVAFGALFALVAARAGLPLAAATAVGAIGGPISLIVHELGHVRAARKCSSVRPISVSLGWLGAATRLAGRYETPGEQARVAIAGPTASFAFAASILFWLRALPMPLGLKEIAVMLALLNVAVGVMSLIPASPLDGYKLALALFWSRLGSEAAARRLLRRVAVALAALEIPGALVLTAEKPVLGMVVIILVAGHFGQKRLLARIHG